MANREEYPQAFGGIKERRLAEKYILDDAGMRRLERRMRSDAILDWPKSDWERWEIAHLMGLDVRDQDEWRSDDLCEFSGVWRKDMRDASEVIEAPWCWKRSASELFGYDEKHLQLPR